MTMRRWLRCYAARVLGAAAVTLGLSLAAGGFAASAAEVSVPRLSARVTDLTGTLSEAQRQSLEASLAAFEQRKGSQIAVLMLPSTQPETIEQYSIRVAEAWKIGRARADDGVILVVAKDDHKLRIEVGRGLEGAVPDVTAKRVIREVIAPHFLNGDFNRGIVDGTAALMKLIEGEPLPPPNQPAAGSSSYSGLEGLLVPLLLLATVILGAFLSNLFGRMVGAAVTGGIVGIAAWVVTTAMLAATLAAIVAFVLVLLFGASGFRSGGSGSGGWGSGGWSGGGSSGGGFSGGGGDFGGGGASGSW